MRADKRSGRFVPCSLRLGACPKSPGTIHKCGDPRGGSASCSGRKSGCRSILRCVRSSRTASRTGRRVGPGGSKVHFDGHPELAAVLSVPFQAVRVEHSQPGKTRDLRPVPEGIHDGQPNPVRGFRRVGQRAEEILRHQPKGLPPDGLGFLGAVTGDQGPVSGMVRLVRFAPPQEFPAQIEQLPKEEEGFSFHRAGHRCSPFKLFYVFPLPLTDSLS